MLYAFLVATILITLAELGDKTQLLALVLASRYKAWQVLVGILGATLVIHLISTIVGAAVGSLVPQAVLSWGAGLLSSASESGPCAVTRSTRSLPSRHRDSVRS